MGVFDKVYEVVCTIPVGRLATYGDVARKLGNIHLSRIVGYALHANPYFGIVPCHRVVSGSGSLSKGFAFGGIDVQKQMLTSEGVQVDDNYCVCLDKYRVQW